MICLEFPAFHNIDKYRIPLFMLEQHPAFKQDVVANLYVISHFIAKSECRVDCSGEFTRTSRNIQESRERPKPHRIIELHGDLTLTLEEFIAEFTGYANLSLVASCLAICDSSMIVHKSAGRTLLLFVLKSEAGCARLLLVFDENSQPIYPTGAVLDSALSLLQTETHYSTKLLASLGEGITVFVYSASIVVTHSDIRAKTRRRPSLLDYLTESTFKATSPISFILQNHKVNATNFFNMREDKNYSRHSEREFEMYVWHSPCDMFKVYAANQLVLLKINERETVGGKRSRHENYLCRVVNLKSKRYFTTSSVGNVKALRWAEETVTLLTSLKAKELEVEGEEA